MIKVGILWQHGTPLPCAVAWSTVNYYHDLSFTNLPNVIINSRHSTPPTSLRGSQPFDIVCNKMPVLLDLLVPFPILELLVTELALIDLVNLSRVSSRYRAILHGFRMHHQKGKQELLVGNHRTSYWEGLKARSILECIEPSHKKNTHKIKSCCLCSLPVCEACIIRDSFLAKRNENTFHQRYRNVCTWCWHYDIPHRRKLLGQASVPKQTIPPKAHPREFCVCSAKNGTLCRTCKVSRRLHCFRPKSGL